MDGEPTLLEPGEAFHFACGPQLACFNECCRDLNQALTPWDVLRLREHLGLTFAQFLSRFAHLFTGPATGFPVVTLRFADNEERRCPFVGPEGCRVYAERPSSCRLYPLARGVSRSRRDGSLSEHYALMREAHCLGFRQPDRWTSDRWIAVQGISEYNLQNDRLLELMSLKNHLRPGRLSRDHQQELSWALYDLEELARRAAAGRLAAAAGCTPPPQGGEGGAWLSWGMEWIRLRLFGGGAAAPRGRTDVSGQPPTKE